MSYLGKEFTLICSHNENINLEVAQVLFSPNLKFGIIYSSSVILFLDLNSKEVTSKITLPPDERISNVKVTQSNSVTYVREKKMNPTEIVTLSAGNHSEYSELKLNQKVIEYDSWLKGGINYLFAITDNYDLCLYKDNQLYIKQNISRDLQILNYQEKLIAKIEYIQAIDILLVITSQGVVLSYYISDDYGKQNKNPRFNFQEISHIAPGSKGAIESVSIKQSWIICDNPSHCNQMDVIPEENDEKDSIHNENQLGPSSTLFLTILSNLNQTDTVISFFDMKQMRLEKRNELFFESATCIDAFIYENTLSHSSREEENDFEGNDDIAIFLFLCFKTVDSFEFHYADLLDCYGKKTKSAKNKPTLAYFNSITEEISNIQKISFVNAIITQNKLNLIKTKSFNRTSSKCLNLMKLNVKIFRRINGYECYLTNEIFSNQLSSQAEEDNEGKIFHGAFSTDVNQYLSFYSRERNSIENMALYRDKVIRLISQDKLLLDKAKQLFNVENSNIDAYLMLLIYNNSLLAIKKYLNSRDSYNYNQFLVPNDVLFDTVKIIYSNLRKCIEKTVRENKRVTELMHSKGISYMKLLIEVMKMIRHRNAHPIGLPYVMETGIMTDEALIIDSYIFDMEVMLMMIKVDKECIQQSIDTNSLKRIDNMEFTFLKIINLCYSQLQLSGNEDNQRAVYSLTELMCNYFNRFSIESLIEYFLNERTINSSLKGLIYYMKFMLFNYYYYLVKVKQSFNNELFFKVLSKEYDEYHTFSLNLFILDQNTQNAIIDPFALNQFFLKLNQSHIIHTQAFKALLSDDQAKSFNALLLKALANEGYFTEAYAISNSLACYYKEYDEWLIHVFILLKQNMFNLAWQAITLFFANDYLAVQMSQISQSNLSDDEKIQSLRISEIYPAMQSMHNFFFRHLIENEHLDILFTLPFTFIEKYLLKIFLLESEKYEELLIVYYAKYRRVREADQCFKDYLKKSSFGKEASKELYMHLIESLFYLFGNEEEKREMKDIGLKDTKVGGNALFIECDVNRERKNLAGFSNEASLSDSMRKNPMISTRLLSDSMNEGEFKIKESFISRNEEDITDSMRDAMKASLKTSEFVLGKNYISSSVKIQSSSFFTKKTV